MKFSANTGFHIYNQGANRQRIFFKGGMGECGVGGPVHKARGSLRATPSLYCNPFIPSNTKTESIEMKFSANTVFHIYNQGANRQRIFFKGGMGECGVGGPVHKARGSLRATPSLYSTQNPSK